MPLDDTGQLPGAASMATPPAAGVPAAAAPAAPSTTPPAGVASSPVPDIRGLIDQSRKMGATDDQIRDLMVKAPFLADTWQASEKAGISPDAVFEHFGLAPPSSNAASADQSASQMYGGSTDSQSAQAPAQSQAAADVNAVGQGLVSGTGAVIAGAGRQATAAGERMTQQQLAAMDAIDQGQDVPAEQDILGYQSMSPAQRSQARSDLMAADADQAKQEPNALTQAGTAVENAAPTMFQVAPENEGIQTGIGRAIGGMVPAVAASMAGTAVGGPVGGVLAGAVAIGSQAYDGTYQEAIAKGSSPEQAEDAAGKAALGQIVAMSLPIGKVIPLIPVRLREGFVQTLVNIGQQGIEIGGGNAVGTLAQNYVASQTYDPSRPLTQGIGTAGLEGTIAGLVIRGGGAAFSAASAKAASDSAIASIGAASDVNGAIAAAAKAVSTPSDTGQQPQLGWSDLFTPPDVSTQAPAAAASTDDGAQAPVPTWHAVDPQEVFGPGRSFRVNTTTGQSEVLEPGGGTESAATPAAASAAPEAANDATPAPEAQSVGAAASSDLDPGVGDLTPAEELAYRSTAEGQKLLEPQSYGAPDNTAYVKGVVPNVAETSQTAAAARELKTLKTMNPDVGEEAANIQASNSDARQQHFQQLAGSDVDVANAKARRDAQMEADTDAAWQNKTDADTQPVLNVASEILAGRAGRQDIVRKAVNAVVRKLYDDDGQPITDPEILYGVGDQINNLLNKNDAGGQKENAAATAQLMALKTSLYDVIEQAAPGFKQALDNYHKASIPIDEMTALQKFEPRLFDANSRMTYAKVQTMMRQIVDSRQAPGLNPYKSISDDTMAGLWNLRDDLRRSASADNLARTPGGSDTMQNAADVARATAAGVGRTALAVIPGVGSAMSRAAAVAQPLLDARAARQRTARGMAMLHPETPPVERPDQPPPAAPFVAQPVPTKPSAPDLFTQPQTPAPTQIEREQAALAAMKARANQEISAQSSTAPSGNLYDSTTALTPSGNPVAVRYVVREANSLTPSQLPDGRANPKFPQELQPRDRTRAASMDQVNTMANKLRPDLLGYAGDTSTGAPVVGPDGIVESGNGRAMAIKRAYAANGEQADAYRTWLGAQGFDVAGMNSPVLVRERTAPLDMAARARLADEMGASPTMAMSASERAAADAKRIPTDVLSMYQSGDVTSPRNAAFIRAFADRTIPAGERASFMTSDGELSAEGAARVRNALTQRAYGNNAIVSALAEDADPNLKAFGGALMDAAGPMAKLRGALESGEVPASDDITPSIVGAANIIQTARRQRISLADAVGQVDAFATRDPMVETVLKAAFGSDLEGRMSRPKLAGLLSNFAAKLQVQSGLFGDNKSAIQVFNEAAQEYGHGTD
jgi:hypothetical protein